MTTPTREVVRRAVLIGAGPRGRRWAEELQQCTRTEIVGIVDVDEAAAHRLASFVPGTCIAVGCDLAEVLRESVADFVVNTTSPSAHVAVTIGALERGLPVLTEKPLADTMAGAESIVAASERHGLLVMTSQNRRYDRRLRAFIRAVRTLGPLEMLSARFSQAPRFRSYQDEMEHPLLVDMAIHHFDVARYILGSDPVAVYCDEFSPSWSWYRHHAAAMAVFRMTDGARFLYDGSWCSDGLRTSWNAEWRATGPRGTATWDGEDDIRCEVGEAGTPSRAPERDAGPEQVAGALEDFLSALDGGTAPMGECHDNVLSLAMTSAAITSAREGRIALIAEVQDVGAG